MERVEELLPGKLKILQKIKGTRFTTDAVLLSALTHVHEGQRVLEIGTGTGVIALLLSYVKKAQITAVEIQKEYAALARRSVEINGLEERVHIVEGDIRTLLLENQTFDVVVCNPPYYPIEANRRFSIYPERVAARSEQYLSIKELGQAIERFLSPEGHFTMIYPTSRRKELLSAMNEVNIQLKEVIDIHPTEDSPPIRFLSTWVKAEVSEIESSRFVLRKQGEESEELKDLYRSLGYERE